MAVFIGALDLSYLPNADSYLRVRFYQQNNYTLDWQPIQAVLCKDFFAEQIAQEQARGLDNSDMWYTNTFEK